MLETSSGNNDPGIQGVDERSGEGEIPLPDQQEAPRNHGLLRLPDGALWGAHFLRHFLRMSRVSPSLLHPALIDDVSTACSYLDKHLQPLLRLKRESEMELLVLPLHVRAPPEARFLFSTGMAQHGRP